MWRLYGLLTEFVRWQNDTGSCPGGRASFHAAPLECTGAATDRSPSGSRGLDEEGDQLTALRDNMPRLADALDALRVMLKDKPTHLRPLIDDKRGS